MCVGPYLPPAIPHWYLHSAVSLLWNLGSISEVNAALLSSRSVLSNIPCIKFSLKLVCGLKVYEWDEVRFNKLSVYRIRLLNLSWEESECMSKLPRKYHEMNTVCCAACKSEDSITLKAAHVASSVFTGCFRFWPNRD